jgi:hypothetical protein
VSKKEFPIQSSQKKIEVFASRVRVRDLTGLRTLTPIPFALLALDNLGEKTRFTYL